MYLVNIKLYHDKGEIDMHVLLIKGTNDISNIWKFSIKGSLGLEVNSLVEFFLKWKQISRSVEYYLIDPP